MMLVLCCFIAFAVGLMAGRFGQWTRYQQIENRLRTLSIECRVAADMGDPVGPEWLADQIDTMVAQDFR